MTFPSLFLKWVPVFQGQMLHMDLLLGVSEVGKPNKVTETGSVQIAALRETAEIPHLDEKKLSLNRSYH